MVQNLAALAAGLFFIFVALRDVFQGVIVPRAENTVLRESQLWPRSNCAKRDTHCSIWIRVGDRSMLAEHPHVL